ncbi:MAG TPA: hypothetical protein VN174_04445 [Candidatus Methanoperedens sp.]|nr:hypothetical protein [Candidatus Methanoperedens sp.]
MIKRSYLHHELVEISPPEKFKFSPVFISIMLSLFSITSMLVAYYYSFSYQ